MENSLEKPIFDTAMKELENTEYNDLYKTIKVSGIKVSGVPTIYRSKGGVGGNNS